MEDIITIDGTGRLVVPKSIRTRLRLEKGTRLRVREEAGQRIVLEPIAEQATPVEVGGMFVIRGCIVGDIPDHREQRTERIRDLARTR
jgi:AbrB family looped-hinge helix DNA binding protein